MPLKFSAQDHSSLFGVGFDPNTHLERLQAADCFHEVRKDIEKNKTKLASLTARSFKRHVSGFRAIVEETVKEDSDGGRRSLLLPFVHDNGTANGVHFVLACLVLSKSRCQKLENTSLVSIFPQLFRGVVGRITVLPETMTAIMTVIKEVCLRIDSPSSKQLLGQSSQV